MKPAVIAAVTNALVAMPSMAGEPGKIFDFNLTLPIIATEFLLLMVILDKTIFGPVGKALDDRDALIRDQLAAVGDNSTAVADLIVSTRERPPRRSPHTRRVFGGRTNAPGAPRAFPARPTARDRRAWRSPPDTWRLTGAREPPIGVRERLDRPLRANRRFDDSVFFSFKLPSADRSFPPRSVSNPQAEKEALISSARAEVAKEVAATKAKMDADIAEASAKAKADVDRQIAAAIAKLDAAKAESAAQVETKATELSNEIINKVVNV